MFLIGLLIDNRNEDAVSTTTNGYRELVATLREVREEAARGGPDSAPAAHLRGKLLARDRIDLLLDRGSPFLELAPSPRTVSTAATLPPPASSPASASSTGGT
jgi:3-methylcrotonyl-CoA carboxylase beta subunit